jgi:2-methylisocitrate lyase-like PEP mutase family enzyme
VTSRSESPFFDLHRSGCFVLANAWDAGSARVLEGLGFPALASTSAGFAYSQGQPDGAVGLVTMLDHLRTLVAATTLPVSADFQDGFASTVDAVAANVTACVTTGVAGLSIEDSSSDGLYGFEDAIDRVRAARAAIDATGQPVVLTARCEAYLVGAPNPQRLVLERLVAFAEAGADCLYAPLLPGPDQIRQVIDAVAPKPVNVLASGAVAALGVAGLAELGVRRISLGSGFARAAWTGFLRLARGVAEEGSFAALDDATSVRDLDDLFARL